MAWGTDVGPSLGGASVDVAKVAVRAGGQQERLILGQRLRWVGDYGKGLGTGRADIQLPG